MCISKLVLPLFSSVLFPDLITAILHTTTLPARGLTNATNYNYHYWISLNKHPTVFTCSRLLSLTHDTQVKYK